MNDHVKRPSDSIPDALDLALFSLGEKVFGYYGFPIQHTCDSTDALMFKESLVGGKFFES
jgi:hypothetical protein